MCCMITSRDHFKREPYPLRDPLGGLSRLSRVRAWTLSMSLTDAFARAGKIQQRFGRRLACRRLAAIGSHGRMLRPECGRRPIQKARDRFPARALLFLMVAI